MGAKNVVVGCDTVVPMTGENAVVGAATAGAAKVVVGAKPTTTGADGTITGRPVTTTGRATTTGDATVTGTLGIEYAVVARR